MPLAQRGVRHAEPVGVLHGLPACHTNDKGQRTWRIENFLNSTRITYRYGQGSTMWLFEGSQKALLVDTAQNTADNRSCPASWTS